MREDTILFFEDYMEDPESVRIDNILSGESYESYLSRLLFVNYGTRDLPTLDEGSALVVHPLVDSGRWMWECQACGNGMIFSKPDNKENSSYSLCAACLYQGWVKVMMPEDWDVIEEELLEQPGFRTNTAFRQWEPHWSIEHLRERTRRAREQIASGIAVPRSASIGSTRLWSVGEVVTANKKNTHERQVMRDLAGRNGPIEYENAIRLWNATMAQRDGLTGEDGMMVYNTSEGTFDGYGGAAWSPFLRYEVLDAMMKPALQAARGTFSHSLGCKPRFGQLILRNDTDAAIHGIPANDYLILGSHSLGDSLTMLWSMYNQTLTTVDIAFRQSGYRSGGHHLFFAGPSGSERISEPIIGLNSQGHTVWVSDLSFGLLIAG